MAKLTADQWEIVRAKREAGASFRELVKEFGISMGILSKRSREEGWGDGKDGNRIANARALELVNGIKSGVHPDHFAAAVEAAAQGKAGVLMRHQADWMIHRESFGPELLQEVPADHPAGEEREVTRRFNRMKMAKISAEMLMIRHAGERKAHGIVDDDGQQRPQVARTLGDFYARDNDSQS